MKSSLSYRPVERGDYGFLYELLERRNPKANITHREMPSWEEHIRFNDSHPYKEDYIIERDGNMVGRVYLTEHTIGIQTLDGSDEEVLQHFRHKGLQVEVAPSNKFYKQTLKKLGFKLLHETWVDQQ